MKVAIDGPAGAGKSSIAKKIAKELGFVYIDTGAMYRTVGLAAINNNIDFINEKEKIIKLMDIISIEVKYIDGLQRMFLDKTDVSDIIRSEAVSMAASRVSAIPEVRQKLVLRQRTLAQNCDCIMDGRDIASHVLPDAECKIYLTASVLTRGKRRYDELIQKGEKCNLDVICRDIEKRDLCDSTREASPLRQDKDAILVDTTSLSFDESVEKVKQLINNCIE